MRSAFKDRFDMLFVIVQEKSELDPRTLKPDLFQAAKVNNTERVLQLLGNQVPPTFIDSSNGWTVLFRHSLLFRNMTPHKN
jgi:hypothetical protein